MDYIHADSPRFQDKFPPQGGPLKHFYHAEKSSLVKDEI